MVTDKHWSGLCVNHRVAMVTDFSTVEKFVFWFPWRSEFYPSSFHKIQFTSNFIEQKETGVKVNNLWSEKLELKKNLFFLDIGSIHDMFLNYLFVKCLSNSLKIGLIYR